METHHIQLLPVDVSKPPIAHYEVFSGLDPFGSAYMHLFRTGTRLGVQK